MTDFMPNEARSDRNKALGKRLALAREALGYGRGKKPGPQGNQSDFATNAGLKPNAYNQWEQGQNFPKVEYLDLLCARYHGLTLDWIYRASYDGMARDLTEMIQKLLDGHSVPTTTSVKKDRKPGLPEMKVVTSHRRRA